MVMVKMKACADWFCKWTLRVILGSMAIVMLFWAVSSVINFGFRVARTFGYDPPAYEQQVSRRIAFHNTSDNEGYLYNVSTGEKLLRHVSWIAKPFSGDSLGIFCDGQHRGFFNVFTGKMVIPPVYARAWQFYCDRAAVEQDGQLFFIDRRGAVVANATVPPCDSLVYDSGYWLLRRNGLWAVLTADSLKTVVPFEYSHVNIERDMGIRVSTTKGVSSLLSFDGQTVLQPICIMGVEKLFYDTSKLEREQASCHAYYSSDAPRLYGLMSDKGVVLTAPVYQQIEAISSTLFLCLPQGVMVNDKGEIISNKNMMSEK